MEVDGCKITYTVPHRIIYRESLKTLLTVLQYIEWSKYNIKQIKIYNDKNQSNVSFYKTTDGESKYNTIYINLKNGDDTYSMGMILGKICAQHIIPIASKKHFEFGEEEAIMQKLKGSPNANKYYLAFEKLVRDIMEKDLTL